jgi:hypothetical protein
MAEQLADGWYFMTPRDGLNEEPDFDKIVNGCCDFGAGASVDYCLRDGYTFEPAKPLTLAEYNDLRAALDAANQRIAELEAQGDWEPVEAGMTAILIKGLERYQRQIGRAEMQGWYKTDVAQTEMERIESMIRGLRGSDDEPPTINLCRRKEGR